MPISKKTGVLTKTKVNPIITLALGIGIIGFFAIFSLMIFKNPSSIGTNKINLNIYPAATEAYFEFSYPPRLETFVFKLTDTEKIQKARNILAGVEKINTHIMGYIFEGAVSYNPSYNYYLDPNSISFFQNAIELCDAEIFLTYPKEYCDQFPTGKCQFCPWGSKLIREIRHHSADVNKDFKIDFQELNHVIAFQQAQAFHCDSKAYSGYAPGVGDHSCRFHSSDYLNGPNWKINLSELLRLIQFFNIGGYKINSTSEDGFTPVLMETITQ